MNSVLREFHYWLVRITANYWLPPDIRCLICRIYNDVYDERRQILGPVLWNIRSFRKIRSFPLLRYPIDIVNHVREAPYNYFHMFTEMYRYYKKYRAQILTARIKSILSHQPYLMERKRGFDRCFYHRECAGHIMQYSNNYAPHLEGDMKIARKQILYMVQYLGIPVQ